MTVTVAAFHQDNSELPSGFRPMQDGVYRRVDSRESGKTWERLCSPLRVLALSRDRSGRGWGRLVEVIDPDGKAHRWSIPAQMFAGDGAELRAALLDLGLDLAPGPEARRALSALLQRWQPSPRFLTTDRLGWADETCTAFVLGDGRAIGSQDVVFQAETTSTVAAEMKATGTLHDWREEIGVACVGNPLMLMAASLAFSGPLLEMLGLEGGGLHLRGASSRGKSSVLKVAVSVWGSPRFLQSWRVTANGLEGISAACNAKVLALDELGEVSGRDAGQAAYMLANGTGKARAGRSGAARPSLRWRVSVLSSGEITLADKIAEAGGRAAAGQDIRLLDIVADDRAYGAFDDLHGAKDGAEFSDRLRRATANQYGTAGPEYVARLLEDPVRATDMVRKSIATFHDLARERFRLVGEGQVQRAVARVGLISAAGELATLFDLTGWPPGATVDAGLDILENWLRTRGGNGSAEAREAVTRVRDFLVKNGSARFEDIGENAVQDRQIFDRVGWQDKHHFYIGADAWRDIHKGADPTRAAKHLVEAGYLRRGDGSNLTTKLPAKVEGRPRAYKVSKEIMGAGDE
ncbi:DUF927 domain-containing protein [Mameliella alba]|uniref:DUF927 domain-containing protein n=1 Tax=Mameliella alba TaxID=561184 RepID=UPI00143049F3|nr:DUF927 domain-containing protein [Mameliella alba]